MDGSCHHLLEDKFERGERGERILNESKCIAALIMSMYYKFKKYPLKYKAKRETFDLVHEEKDEENFYDVSRSKLFVCSFYLRLSIY